MVQGENWIQPPHAFDISVPRPLAKQLLCIACSPSGLIRVGSNILLHGGACLPQHEGNLTQLMLHQCMQSF